MKKFNYILLSVALLLTFPDCSRVKNSNEERVFYVDLESTDESLPGNIRYLYISNDLIIITDKN